MTNIKQLSDVTISHASIEWEMDWTSSKATSTNEKILSMPDKEIIFEEEQALAYLLCDEVVFLNNHWWKKEWTDEQRELFSINVNCNDCFMWASADAEELKFNELRQLWWHYKMDTRWGAYIWCIKKRGMLPQKTIYKDIQLAGVWNLDEMGLQNNPTWD